MLKFITTTVENKVLNQNVQIKYVCSADQIDDIHTKSLSKARFLYLQSKISLCSPPFSLGGCEEQLHTSIEQSPPCQQT